MRRFTTGMAAMLLAAAAHAEIYSWREGGTTRYSNAAPAWYSPTEPSRIRTRVLVNGVLVDDTGLPPEERDRLRAQRARAEAWNRPGAETTARNGAAPPAPAPALAPAPAASESAKPPAPPPVGAKPGDAPAKPTEAARAAPGR